MRFKTVTYQKVKNLGNYESERLEMSVELDENDQATDVAENLRLTVNNLLEQAIPPTTPKESKTKNDSLEYF